MLARFNDDCRGLDRCRNLGAGRWHVGISAYYVLHVGTAPTQPWLERVLFGRRLAPNIWNGNHVTDAECLHDIGQKLRCWGYLSHYPDAERDVTWLLDRLAEQGERIA